MRALRQQSQAGFIHSLLHEGFTAFGRLQAFFSFWVTPAADQAQTEGDNDELEEGEMRDEEDERDVAKLSGSRVALAQAAKKASSGGGIRKRQWGIRRPSVKTYVEVPLSSQALNTLVEVNAAAVAAAAVQEEEEEEAPSGSRAKDRLSESVAPVSGEGDNRQVRVEEAMEEGEVPSTPASELVSSAPPLAILTSDEAGDEGEAGDARGQLLPASPPAPSPVTHDTSPPKPSSPTSKARKKGLRETRAVGYHVEDPIRGRDVEQATQPASDTINIRGLVRPFTLNQLKDLLARFGNLLGFWIDRVKSKAFVRFESTEEATAAREDLDGCKWPSINPRLLRVDFSSQEELEWMMEHGETGKPFPKAAAAASRSSGGKSSGGGAAGEKTGGESGRKEEGGGGSKSEGRARERPGSPEARKRARGRSSDREAAGSGGKAGAAPVREWDRDKIRQSDSPPSRRARRRSRSREKAVKPAAAKERKKEEPEGKPAPAAKEEPARLLDDLFRKTKVVPSIYWLPLTEEQIKTRQREREERSKRPNRSPPGPERAEAASRSGPAGPAKGFGPSSRQAGAGRRRTRSRSRSRSRRREWDSRRR